MKLTPNEVEQIAALARLELSNKEKKMYAEQLSAVLDYVEMLKEVETEETEETCQVTGLEDVTREDIVESCDKETRDKLLTAFPERRGDLLRVKGVFEAAE